ncbi:hypothetical protein CRE_30145 [Caenorhabditis remanei]|uniref:Uncharacterized protein n=1 Tax=Caenorhabditis remanei TaxID=31234 RepID=E3NAI9_CAERE|nr:hypothetical protein CRE_30145 [Caenorhabditis remanei]
MFSIKSLLIVLVLSTIVIMASCAPRGHHTSCHKILNLAEVTCGHRCENPSVLQKGCLKKRQYSMDEILVTCCPNYFFL